MPIQRAACDLPVRMMHSWNPRVAAAILAALVAPTGSASAQDASVFSMLEGEWAGEGTLFGQAARFRMRWEPREGFMVLSFANAMVGADGTERPIVRAVAIYRTAPATGRATWEDSRGVQIAITWTATDSTLVSDWRAPTEAGRTTYRIRSDGTVTVEDEVERNGALQPFGEARYARSGGS